MKKSMLFGSFVMLALFPAYLSAQDIKLPTVEIRAGQDLVPAKVKEAVLIDFGAGHKPIAWVNTGSLFDTYEWQHRTNVANLDVYAYAIQSKTSTGSTLDALYTSDGNLISSREYLVNFRPSNEIMLALQNTSYRDWGLKNTSHLIKFSSSGSEKERYALVMSKGKEKKTILFDSNGRMLAEKPGEHLELADLDR